MSLEYYALLGVPPLDLTPTIYYAVGALTPIPDGLYTAVIVAVFFFWVDDIIEG